MSWCLRTNVCRDERQSQSTARFCIRSVILGIGHKRSDGPCSSLCVLAFGSPDVTACGTRPVTSREMSVAVESRDVNLVFGEDLKGSSYDVSFDVP